MVHKDYRKFNFINTSISAGASLLSVFFISQAFLELKQNSKDIGNIKSDIRILKGALNVKDPSQQFYQNFPDDYNDGSYNTYFKAPHVCWMNNIPNRKNI